MIRRAVVVVGVGVALAPALALAGAFPAGAATVVDYRQYQQTLPASVIDGGTLTDDEKVATTNGTRAGVLTKPLVPLGTSTYTRGVGGAAGSGLFLLDTLLYMSDELRAEQTYDRSQPKPSWIDQEEWDACATSGGDDWAGDLFDGLRDWTASLGGTDCNDVRAGWAMPKNPAYTPVGASNSPGGYPLTATRPTGSMTLLEPIWSDTLYTISGVTRKEGWIQPINFTGTGNYYVHGRLSNASGVVTNSDGWNLFASTTTFASNVVATGACGAAKCLRLDQWYATTTGIAGGTTGVPTSPNWALTGNYVASIKYIDNSSGTNFGNLDPLPYVNTLSGEYVAGLARQVLLTAVRTEAGNLYQCRTESFVETAPTIPRPCEPAVPDWEVITERTVEVVPETDTGYVPGSNPTRGIQTTTIPDVVRDWQRDFPDCDETLCLLDLELEMVGSCFDNPDLCADWYTDPNKTTRYTCTYGGVVVDLSQCVKYARLFKPNALTTGTAYPAPGPSSPPTAAPAPGQTTSTIPSAPLPPGSTASNPNAPRNCFPEGWGLLNPLEWVFKPVRCALEWAFVPRQSAVDAVANNLRLKWTGSSLVGLLTVFESGRTMFLDASGCEGPEVVINAPDFGMQYAGHPLSACGEVAPYAAFSHTFTGIVAWGMAVASIARSIAGVVAFRGIGGDDA